MFNVDSSFLPLKATDTPKLACSVLPVCTACGLVFDRLARLEPAPVCETRLGSLAWTWRGEHGLTPRSTPWSVRWTNGQSEVELTLVAGTGSWSWAQCYFDRLPAALARLLVADAFEPWWAVQAGGPWMVTSNDDRSWAPGGAQVCATVAARNLSFTFTLAFDSAAGARAFGARRMGERSNRRAVATHLRVPCELRLPVRSLSRRQLVCLRTGDALLVDRSSALRAVLWAGWPARPLLNIEPPAAPQQRGWRAADHALPLSTELLMHIDPPLSDDAEEPECTPMRVALDELRFPVEIVAGRGSMSLAALHALQPGDLLDPHLETDAAEVSVRVGGRPYASGRLVAFQDQLAVQLTRIWNPGQDSLHE